jgi:hypothetical protein
MVCRIQRFSRSILLLLYEGNAEAAFVLLRAIYEDIFQSGYMATDPVNLGSQCRGYGLIDGIVHMKYREHIGGTRTVEVDAMLDELKLKHGPVVDEFTIPGIGANTLDADCLNRKYYDNWTKLDLATVARNAGLIDYYDTTYRYCLSYVHGGRRLQEQFATRNEEGFLMAFDPNKEPADEDVRHVLRQLSLGHLLLVEILCKAYAIAISNKYEELDKDWKQLVQKDVK